MKLIKRRPNQRTTHLKHRRCASIPASLVKYITKFLWYTNLLKNISPGEHLSSIAASETIQVSMQIIYCTITLFKITLAFPRSSTLSLRQEGGWRWRVIAAMCFSISPLYGLFSICWNTYKKQIKLKLIESDGYII